MQNPSGWLRGIQYFRAIAIIEVITVHVLIVGAEVPNPLWVIVVLTAFTSFGVPQFIFISGVVLYNKYNNGFSLSAFYRKRFSAVVPPYVVWSTFYFAFYHVGSNESVATLAITYSGQLIHGIQHLWFVVIIIELYLLYPLLEKMYNHTTKQNSPIYILSLLLLAQILYSSLVTAFPLRWVSYYLNVLSYFFYFVFGFFIAQHYEAIKQRIATFSLKSFSLVVLVSTICYAVLSHPAPLQYTWFNVVMDPFYCLLLILFYLRISTQLGEPRGFFLRYLEKIGEDSFGIFLIHYFFVVTFTSVLFMLGLSAYNLILYPVLFLLTIISSYLAVEAIYRLPFSNVIIGKRRKKQASPTQTSLTN